MARQMLSTSKTKALSLVLFFLGLAIVSYLDAWWPGIMLAIGIPLALRQYLLGRHYDMYVSLFVFIGVFVTVQFEISWHILLPVLFTIGGIYVFFREFLESDEVEEAAREEDVNHEIEEEEEEKKHHKKHQK